MSRMRRLLAEAVAATLAVTLVPAPAFAQAEPETLFRFADDTIDESSGLVDLGGLVLTVNDSGDDAVVYAVDARTGETVGRTSYTSDEVLDVEALAQGPDGSVWVADIGDNRANRLFVSLYRLPPVGRGDRAVTATRYDLVYPGRPRDAETLLVHPQTGRVYVVSKGLFGGNVFAAPERLRTDAPNRLRKVGDAGGLVTDGAFLPDGRHAVLRNYSDAVVFRARGWKAEVGFDLPSQKQGEGIAVSASGRRVVISSEGAGSEVVAVPFPRPVRRVLEPPTPSPSPSTDDATPAPEVGEGAGDRDEPGLGTLVGLIVAVLGAALGIRLALRGAQRVRDARRRSRSRR